jgi:PPM family protein phosphatase
VWFSCCRSVRWRHFWCGPLSRIATSRATPVTTLLRAAGDSHPGLHRETNEDRFYVDASRGLFMVVDGVGGHAAGERAADIAVALLRVRLERATGTVENRVREAIAMANNEIHRQASLRPEWRGMACVLTVAVIDVGSVVVGHVGDTRLYKLRAGRIEKLTRDHSPVGEREDAHELSELEAMRHPRRNEVYRDVGSDQHEPTDRDFIDVFRVPFEPDAALLLCSDGLTDCVTSATIEALVEDHAGNPEAVVRALIDAANGAGGKDNVTALYVEGATFARGDDTRDLQRRVTILPSVAAIPQPPDIEAARGRSRRWRVTAIVVSIIAVAGAAAYLFRARLEPLENAAMIWLAPRQIVVRPAESIASALERAAAGTEIIVEPGDYRERIEIKSGVRIRSRVPRGATLKPPAAASQSNAAVTAVDVIDGELSGFRIVGDANAPLDTGVLLRNADVALVDVEITGVRQAGVEFAGGAGGMLIASEIHDNTGAGLVVRSGAAPRVAHSVFTRNGTGAHAPGAIFVEPASHPTFDSNTFVAVKPELLVPGGDAAALQRENWFVDQPIRRAPAATPPSRTPNRQ